MEARLVFRNFIFSKKAALKALTLLALLSAGACSTTRSKNATNSPNSGNSHPPYPSGIPPADAPLMGPPEPYGPPVIADPQSQYGPEPTQAHAIVLVLGPGLAPGFAQVGVLRILSENHIPVAAIVSAETGSLLSALYALSNNINKFEYLLMRFKAEDFVAPPGFFTHILNQKNQESEFEDKLKKVFGTHDLTEFSMPNWIAIEHEGSTSVDFVKRGKVASVVRAAMANPMVFSGIKSGSRKIISDSDNLKDLIAEARSLNRGPVVVVDVSGGKQLGSDTGDLLISPEVQGMGPLEFSKMQDAAFQGRSAALAKLPALQSLVGLAATATGSNP